MARDPAVGTIEFFTLHAPAMKVTLMPVTPFQQNSSLLVCESTGRAAIVDPGGDLDIIKGEVERQNVSVEKVLLTHGHIDHAGAAAPLSGSK